MSDQATIGTGIARAVLQADTEPHRFEKFCCELLSEIEGGGGGIVTTSQSWDRGRDGRSVGAGVRVIVCATLTPRIDAKMRSDLLKALRSTPAIEKIYFCVSQDVSEHTLDEIATEIRKETKTSVIIDGLSASQLALLSSRFGAALRKYYPAELRDVIATFAEPSESDDEFKESALLALATAAHPNSGAIRAAAYRDLALRTMADGESRSIGELCRDISNRLRLRQPLPSRVFQDALDTLCAEALIESNDEHWRITEGGRSSIQETEEQAARELFEGKQRIRDALTTSLGTTLEDSQFQLVWDAMQTRLARFFYVNGRKMVTTLASLGLTPEQKASDAEEAQDLFFFVEEVAEAAASTCTSGELREEVRTAVTDIFSQRSGVAFEWLTRVAASFVLVCALGLEATSGERIRQTIASIQLVLDTDVVLELLGQGEPGYDGANLLVNEWRRHGGTILVAHPVAEEVAHHAWIAEVEFQDTGGRFLATEIDRRRYLRNVFLRAFGAAVEAGRTRHRWRSFIKTYQGSSPADTSVVLELLQSDYHMKVLPDADLNLEPGKSVWSYLDQRQHENNRDGKIQRDKARRDARLFASLALRADALGDAGRGETCILVTSSARLHRLESRFPQRARETLSLSSALYLLAMVPGVSIGLGAFRSVLFDGRLIPRLESVDRLILRAIQDSTNWEVPWAKRSRLIREVRGALLSAARDRGDTKLAPENVAAPDADEEQQRALTSAIAKGLDAIGATPRIEDELAAAKKRVRELEEQLRRRST